MPDQSAPTGRKVVLAGASGLIGTALAADLRADGVQVTTLVRRPPTTKGEVHWLSDTTPLDPGLLAGADAVVGLNGASIGRFPWTSKYQSELLWSRITPTRALARAIRELGKDAPAFVSASAVGFYGSAPGETLTEDSPRGSGFLADLCAEWESAAQSVGEHSRVVRLRTAPVVHRDGVLKPLMLLTRFGLSGPISRGTQAWPWISLEDEVRAIRHVIDNPLSGAVNLTGPTRATANDLGFALAKAMNRPFLLRAPRWGLRMGLGPEAADGLLLADANVVPEALQKSGFSFRHPRVEDAVAAALA